MVKLLWDQIGERTYETGVDHGVLYVPNVSGVYDTGVAWNGLTTVTESPSGAESNPQYADNIKYVDILSAEEFAATVEALTYPVEFEQCDGSARVNGVSIGQQGRKSFGLAYRTRKGNDVQGTSYGYKLHLVYGATAAPSEKAYSTINDSPEAITFSWELSTTPVPVGVIGGTEYRPTATLTIDSTQVTLANLQTLEDELFGTAGTSPRLPTPAEVIAMFDGVLTQVTPAVPTFVSTTGVITIPTTTGVDYKVDGIVRTGTYTVTGGVGDKKIVVATPKATYKFPNDIDTDWQYTRTA